MLTDLALEKINDHVPVLMRCRYLMFKGLLDHEEIDLDGLCTKLGWTRRKAQDVIFTRRDINLRDLAEWLWAIDREADVKIIPRLGTKTRLRDILPSSRAAA